MMQNVNALYHESSSSPLDVRKHLHIEQNLSNIFYKLPSPLNTTYKGYDSCGGNKY